MAITKWVAAMTLCMSICVEAFTANDIVRETSIKSSRLFSAHKMISSISSDDSMSRREILKKKIDSSIGGIWGWMIQMENKN